MRGILDSLPDWFGRPEASATYVAEALTLDCATARLGSVRSGFASLKPLTTSACEIAEMAILPAHHRQGHGRALMGTATDWMRDQGYDRAVVRTVGPGSPDPAYAATRRFYEACGFLADFEVSGLWGPGDAGTPHVADALTKRRRALNFWRMLFGVNPRPLRSDQAVSAQGRAAVTHLTISWIDKPLTFTVGLALLVLICPIGTKLTSKPAGVRTAIELMSKKSPVLVVQDIAVRV